MLPFVQKNEINEYEINKEWNEFHSEGVTSQKTSLMLLWDAFLANREKDCKDGLISDCFIIAICLKK